MAGYIPYSERNNLSGGWISLLSKRNNLGLVRYSTSERSNFWSGWIYFLFRAELLLDWLESRIPKGMIVPVAGPVFFRAEKLFRWLDVCFLSRAGRYFYWLNIPIPKLNTFSSDRISLIPERDNFSGGWFILLRAAKNLARWLHLKSKNPLFLINNVPNRG